MQPQPTALDRKKWRIITASVAHMGHEFYRRRCHLVQSIVTVVS